MYGFKCGRTVRYCKKTMLKKPRHRKGCWGGRHDLKAMSPYLETEDTNTMPSFDLRSYQCLFWIYICHLIRFVWIKNKQSITGYYKIAAETVLNRTALSVIQTHPCTAGLAFYHGAASWIDIIILYLKVRALFWFRIVWFDVYYHFHTNNFIPSLDLGIIKLPSMCNFEYH